MQRLRISSAEFERDFDAWCDKALHQPVYITDERRGTLVMISMEMWQRLKSGGKVYPGIDGEDGLGSSLSP